MKYIKIPVIALWAWVITQLPWFIIGVYYIVRDIGALLA